MQQLKTKKREEELEAFSRLLDIMDELREKCPWDKKQTMQSLTMLTVEEVYEAVEAVQNSDMNELEGELGDLFLHLVFYSKIGSEQGDFDVASVLNRVCEKLIYRHPHIYADTKATTEEEVKRNWEQLKLKEGKRENKTLLYGVPKISPALLRAQRIQEKVAGVGFEFDNVEDVQGKIKEELEEFLAEKTIEKQKEEFGDTLFSLVNLARFLKINSEEALNITSSKFIERFNRLEQMVNSKKEGFGDIVDKRKLNEYWDYVKKNM